MSLLLCGALLATAPSAVLGQETIQTESVQVVSISRGSTAVISRPDSIMRISIADPNVAEAVPIPPGQVLINAKSVGTTSLVIWGRDGVARMFTIDVTADVASLRRQLEELFPDAGLEVNTTGQTVILSGEVRDPSIVRKALEVAATFDVPIVNNVQAPAPEQVLLHVEFAEVSRSVLKELGGELLRVLNPSTLDHAFDQEDTHEIEAISEGVVTLMVEGAGSRLDAVIGLLKNSGEFKSLAQPNLVTVEGQEATFLAGGEFPFPTIQGGQSNAVTITWKEYGIRLAFTPDITNSGNVRLKVAPEVSSLDFANGLTFSGFQIPSILARRVETDVELRSGQTLAIGGLLDNSMLTDVDKIPLLGDLPLLGFLFRSENIRQNRSELIVLVTPYILDPTALPAPDLPTGDANDWKWDGHIGDWIKARTDTTTAGAGGGLLDR
jgi:pilus assembly protein CpaC